MASHQIVAIGDLHLRSLSARNAARLKALDQVIGEGLALPHLAAWVQLGDVFDGRSSIQDRNDLAERLQRMAARAPVFILYGNHDAPNDLDIFAKLVASHPILVAAWPVVQLVTLATGALVEVAMLPYPQRGGLIANGSTADVTLQTGAEHLDAIFRGFVAAFADARQRDHLMLFAGHVNVEGAQVCAGQPQIGRELSITTAMLEQLGHVPKLLGHIHAPQTIAGAHYAGSLTANDWGEREAKRWLLVEYDDAGSFQILSRPIDTPRLFHVEGEWRSEPESPSPIRFAWRVTAGPAGELQDPPPSWIGTEVRVRYRVAASERPFVDEAAIRAPFADASRLEVEPVVIPDRALRAPEVAAARTLAEKLDAWTRLDGGRAVPASVLQKLVALEHGDATAILSGVATQVAALEHGQKAEGVA